MIVFVHDCKEPLLTLCESKQLSDPSERENISHSFSLTMASRSKCRRVPTDQLESVVNEICTDDESGDEIMIPELDEVDSGNTVIDSDPQNSNHEHLGTTTAVPDTPTSWTNRDIVPTIAPFTSSSWIKIHVAHKMHPFSWIKNFLDDDFVNHITTETNRYAHQ
jgi:hypothetical protein